MLSRFNSSHWKNATERARYSIPADPRRDDDIRLGAYIEQTATLRTSLTTALSLLRRWESYLETVVEDESDDGMLAEDTRALLAKHPEKP